MNVSARAKSAVRVRLKFLAYPLRSSLGALGRKWALLVLMNIALGRARRFNELRRRTPGMSKRILAMRLRELEQGGFISRADAQSGFTQWELTPKGTDVLPVLLTLLHFTSKWRGIGETAEQSEPSWGRDFEIVVHRPSRTETSSNRERPLGRSRRRRAAHPVPR